MTDVPSPSLGLRQPHWRAGVAALGVLVLTSIHHAYGAYAFATPWRLHILLLAVPAGIAIAAALQYGAAMAGRRAGQLATVFAAVLILVIPVAAIGIYEGGYNHVLKNLVYFIFGEAETRALFPPPLYEMPRDVIFEATGIAQFPLAILTASRTLPLLRGTRP